MFPFTAVARDKQGSVRGGAKGHAAPLDGTPALRGAVESVLGRLVKGLQAMAGATTVVEGAVAGSASETAAALVASHGPEGAAALLESPALAYPMVATLDATLIHTLVELLCGGNGNEAPVSGRPASAIDRQFAQILFNLVASAIQGEWASFGFGPVKVTRVEAGLPADVFGPHRAGIGVVDLTVGVFGQHGTLRLALPPQALERVLDASGDVEPSAVNSDPLGSTSSTRKSVKHRWNSPPTSTPSRSRWAPCRNSRSGRSS